MGTQWGGVPITRSPKMGTRIHRWTRVACSIHAPKPCPRFRTRWSQPRRVPSTHANAARMRSARRVVSGPWRARRLIRLTRARAVGHEKGAHLRVRSLFIVVSPRNEERDPRRGPVRERLRRRDLSWPRSAPAPGCPAPAPASSTRAARRAG